MNNSGHGGKFKHLDLFSGIGGFSLAFESCGFETIGFVECDPIKCVVLKDWWPNTPILPDVRDIESIRKFCEPYGTIDVITAGVPCQPASTLGKQRGTADERWMWPATIELVRCLRPRFFVAENPPAVITLERGRAWNGIVSGLVACGYDLQWDVFPAGAFGAGHRRERVILVATDARYATTPTEPQRQREEMGREQFGGELLQRDASNADSKSEPREGMEANTQKRSESNPHIGGSNQNASNANKCSSGMPGLEQGSSWTRGRPLHTHSESDVADAAGNRNSKRKKHSGGGGLNHVYEQSTSTHSNSPRLQGHAGDEDGCDGGASEKRPTAPPDLRGRVRDFGNGFPWWHEINTGVPVLATGLPNKLVEGATRCIGDSVVPQAIVPVAKAIYEALSQ